MDFIIVLALVILLAIFIFAAVASWDEDDGFQNFAHCFVVVTLLLAALRIASLHPLVVSVAR